MKTLWIISFLFLVGPICGCVSTRPTTVSECSFSTGDTVHIRSIQKVYSLLNDIKKREFESKQQHMDRISNVLASFNNGPIVVRSAYDSKYLQYDADKEQFKISFEPWVGINHDWYHWDEIFRENEIDNVGTMPFGITLSNKITSGPYAVTTNYRQFAVFDRWLSSWIGWEPKNFWKFDYRAARGNSAGAFLPVPLEKAKNLKERLNFGVEFKPRYPFVIEGRTYHGPYYVITSSRYTKLFTGDIRCIVITDENHQVLKTIMPRH